jgi:uncharacterized protein involved in exopolysaccharide biosynthesis/Mrp family chromosome partitioning ATPase
MFVRQAARDKAGRKAPVAPQSWENPAPSQNANRELIKGSLTVSRLTTFVRRNGYKTISLAAILFTIGVFVLSVMPVRYAATALVVVDPREARVTNEQDVLPGIGQDPAALQSLIEIAKSDGFLRPLMVKLKVADDDDVSGGEKESSRVLEKFRKRLDISRRGLTYVIGMTFVSDRPEQAARYANAVAEAFVASQNQVRTEATDGAAGFLNSRLKSLSDRLRVSEDAVAAFKAEHRIVNAGRESTTRQLKVTELSQQVSAARLRAEEAKNRYDQAQRDLKANVDVPSGARTEILNVLRAQRTQLNDQIAQKRAVLGDRHPDLVMAYSQLNELNHQIETERKRAVDGAKSDYETVLEQQRSLERQLKALEGEMLDDGQAAVKLQELQRVADANRNIYEQFLSRFKTTDEQRLFQTSQTKVASAAIPPTRSTRPPLALILVGIAIGALLSATAIVTLLEAVRPANDAAKTTSPDGKPATADLVQNLRNSIGRHGSPGAGADPSVWRPSAVLEATRDSKSHMQELLDSIEATPAQRGSVVLVTSGERGVGSGVAARALNAAAIERGLLSVLIEVLPKVTVLHDGQSAAERETTGYVRVLGTDARSVILLLDPGPNVAVSTFPGDVRQEFDLIVIDAPSPAEQADVVAISAHVDHTVIVARNGSAYVPAINRAKAAITRSGNSTVAVVADDRKSVDNTASRMMTPARRDSARLATLRV